MKRRRFLLNTALLAVPVISGCNSTGTESHTATTASTTTPEPTRETSTYNLEYRLSGEHVSKAPGGVNPSPYPTPEYENPYITELVRRAVAEPIGEDVVVDVPRDDHEAVEEAYPKLNGDESGAYVEYDGSVVRILFYILE